MKTKIVFATHNEHKLREVAEVLKDRYQVIGLTELGCTEDIEETADTLQGNAHIKSMYVYEKYGYDCFSDDTGLEVDALNGAPGVYSARYGGGDHDSEANIKKLLHNMEGVENRSARFKTVISLIEKGKERLFEGVVEGDILVTPIGDKGFGYDPVFVPKGYDKSFAELGDEVKNKISHRALAVNKLVDYLQTL